MMKSIKTSELTGASLDWVVAKCEYDNRRYNYGSPCFNPKTKQIYETKGLQEIGVNFSPSTDWKQGGPIIERERISVIRLEDDEKTDKNGFWIPGRVPVYAAVIGEYFSEDQLRNGYGEAICDTYYIDCELVTKGPTHLVAAMRCYVASKLGDTIEVPEELL